MKKLWLPLIIFILFMAGCDENTTSADEVSIDRAMILIPSGAFEMGCCEEDSNLNEQPVHLAYVSSFYMSKYEVTQKEFRQVMGYIPDEGYGIGNDYPVFGVSWEEAMQYCNNRSEAESLQPCYDLADSTCNWAANGYRLPTEAEWEYAARGAGSDLSFNYAGADNIGDVGWYRVNSGNQTHKVGQKLPNSLGLYDMSGNVWERCWDWYSDEYYQESPYPDPKGPGTGYFRVVRGGSWYNEMQFCCCTFRAVSEPFGSNYIGLRVVRNAG
ncbi:MAG: formylglycine-generating enzyme family protein [Candidatus Stygibacter australis]|nr:formylglycine-generating enzyme family protein [Candidatus Stygibacter australis]